MTALALPAHTQLELPVMDGSLCQRWDNRVASWRRTSEGGFNPARYGVFPLVDDVDARAFIQTHHYSRSYPAASLRYGLVDQLAGGRLVGVAVLGVPMSAAVLTRPFPGLVPYKQSLELSRLVLLDEVMAPAETWFLTRAFKMAAAQGVRGVVMFSDPMPRYLAGILTMPGHVGTIYKALNCRYTGRGTARTLTILPDGSVLPDRSAQKIRQGERGAAGVVARLVALGAPHPSMVTDWPGRSAGDDMVPPALWLSLALEVIGARKVRHRGNHRYILPIGDRGARRNVSIALDSQPFPKTADPIF